MNRISKIFRILGDFLKLVQVRFFLVLYPVMRQKDAGYLALVLTYWVELPLDKRRDLPNFKEVEECHEFLLREPKHKRDEAQGTASLPRAWSPDWVQVYMHKLYQVERAVLSLQTYPQLLARLPQLVGRLRTVASEKAEPLKQQYEREFSEDEVKKLSDAWIKGDPSTRTVDWLRAKMMIALDEIQWWQVQSMVREELFFRQFIAIIIMFLLLATCLSGIYFAQGYGKECDLFNHNVRLFTLVAFVGMTGSFTSILRRMHNDVAQHGGGTESTYKELTALAYGKIGVIFGLVFGMVFSIVLCLIFASHLTTSIFSTDLNRAISTIFPELPLALGKMEGCSLLTLPIDGGVNFAKLLVWSFLAGFAEQLVPDALDRLTKKAGDVKKVG